MQLQVVEVSIGLIAAFLLVSILASAFVDLMAMALKKRSKDLERVVDAMLSTGSTGAIDLRGTSVYRAMQTASRRKRGPGSGPKDDRFPSYMSARSFADGVIEGLVKLKTEGQNVTEAIASLPDGALKQRLLAVQAEVGGDLLAVKAGIEGWFDDTMDRLQGAYKRWSQWVLFAVGIALAVGLNVSAVRIVDSLWNDAVLREAVANQAGELEASACEGAEEPCTPQQQIEGAIADIDSLALPVGWTSDWDEESGGFLTVVGMLVTGAAVMVGAQFWFDLLSRLVGARATGGVPPRATIDRGSATAKVAEARPLVRSLAEL